MQKEINPSGAKPSGMMRGNYAIKLLKKYAADKNAHILDLGCSSEIFLRLLQENGYKNIEGAGALRYKSNFDFKVKFADFSYEKLPWDDKTFDIVTAWEVVEHLENPHFAMKEAKRILKDGGLLILSMPNPFHILSRWNFLKRGDLPRWNAKNDHISIFTKTVFKKTFLRIGINLPPAGILHKTQKKSGIPGQIPARTRIVRPFRGLCFEEKQYLNSFFGDYAIPFSYHHTLRTMFQKRKNKKHHFVKSISEILPS